MKIPEICCEAPRETCLLPEEVVNYLQRMLSPAEKARAEEHLQTCNACVNEVKTAVRIVSFIASRNKAPVPAALRARVRSLWQDARKQDYILNAQEESADGREGKEKGPTR